MSSEKSILDHLIEISLLYRGKVLAITLLTVLVAGGMLFRQSIDVLPDLNRPVVTVIAEAHGMAPAEVENLVTIPIESALSGAAGITGIRSVSKRGVTLIKAEFEWGSDIYRNRQIVSEKLSTLESRIPDDISPQLGPISSIMGEIQLIGLYSRSGETSLRELRTIADWRLRRQLLTINGVSNVIVIGGYAKEYHIIIESEKLAEFNVSFETVQSYLKGVGSNTTGGFLQKDGREYVIRNIGELYDYRELEEMAVGYFAGVPVRVRDIGRVELSHKVPRGDAGVNGRRGVILAVQKQPGASTLRLTDEIDRKLNNLKSSLPEDIETVSDLFQQAGFINTAVENVYEAIRDGSIFVIIVLFLFLWNFRTTFITLTAIPLSLLVSVLILTMAGHSINTMTLGGFAVAIGLLVDDAIVDVENILRRLRDTENKGPSHALKIIVRASAEIRSSIVLATVIVVLVFVPLLMLPGVEGRLFRPLALSFIISLGASLLVALTVTPVLSFYLLPELSQKNTRESYIARRLKNLQAVNLKYLLPRPYLSMSAFSVLIVLSLLPLKNIGTEFMPDFNEGTLTLEVINSAGVSLEESVEKAREIEKICLSTEGVGHVSRRTGRSELDEHAEGVHYSEFDVTLDQSRLDKSEIVNRLRSRLSEVKDVSINFGQPVSHRLDHLLSGIRAEVAVFIYGHDLQKLLRYAYEIESMIKEIEGAADILTETQSYGPELKIAILPESAGRFGISTGELTRNLESFLQGKITGHRIEDDRIFDIRLILEKSTRENITALENLVLKYQPDGRPVYLRQVADIFETRGPYEIKRENGRRRIAVQFNVTGRDPGSAITELRGKINNLEPDQGYFTALGGRFQTQQRATALISIFGTAALLLILLLLKNYFRSWLIALQILLNIPFSLIGAFIVMYYFNVHFSLASIVGLISLAGIASRNGILMISNYIQMTRSEKGALSEDTIIRASVERLIPVLMTALTAVLGLLPILLSGSEAAGREILYPVAVVISGGLVSSTLLDVFFTPVVFYYLARRTDMLKKVVV